MFSVSTKKLHSFLLTISIYHYYYYLVICRKNPLESTASICKLIFHFSVLSISIHCLSTWGVLETKKQFIIHQSSFTIISECLISSQGESLYIPWYKNKRNLIVVRGSFRKHSHLFLLLILR